MIRSYNDHAANERTFLAWVRTGLSAVALGIVVKKGSLLASMVATTAAVELPGDAQGFLGNYGGSSLVGIGIAAIAVASTRFVCTALRIDEQTVHSAGIVRVATALLRGWRRDPGAFEPVSADEPASASEQKELFRRTKQLNLRLVAGTDAHEVN